MEVSRHLAGMTWQCLQPIVTWKMRYRESFFNNIQTNGGRKPIISVQLESLVLNMRLPGDTLSILNGVE